jgi:hypothetical protein
VIIVTTVKKLPTKAQKTFLSEVLIEEISSGRFQSEANGYMGKLFDR